MKDLPFSFYEFVAILMPGFIFTMPILLSYEPIPNFKEGNILHVLFVVSIAYIVGQVIGQFSYWLIDSSTKKILGEPALILLGKENGNCLTRFLFNGYYAPLQQKVISKYENLIGAKDNKDIIACTYGPVFTKARMDAAEYDRINHWSRLFGFSRNLSLGFICYTIALVMIGYQSSNYQLYWVGAACLFLSIIMYYRYLRFFRTWSVDLIQWFAAQDKPL